LTTKLSEIISVLESGSRPKGGVKEGSEGIPSLGGEHLSKEGGFNFSKLKMITHEFYSKMKRGKIEIGDILIVKDGATTGKVAIVREDFPFKEAAINEHLFRIRVDSDKAIQEYIFRYLQSPLGQLQILSSFRGAAIGGINTSFVDRVSLDLPPLDEQKRIAAILDKTYQIKQASDKTEDMREKFANAIFLDIFGDPVLNTKNWNTLPMTEIFEIITGKLDSNAAVEGGEYPFFTCAKEASQIDHFAFDCECLLLAGNNASGDFDVKYYNGKFNAYQRTYILTTDKIEYDYARFALDYQLKKLKQSSLGTNTRYLTMGIFKRMHIQIPSRDLQKQFSLYYNALRNSAERDRIKVDELQKSTESLILMKH